MFKNILVATDGSELADKAVLHGVNLAQELRAALTFITVIELWTTLGMATKTFPGRINPTESYENIQVIIANRVLKDAADKAKMLGVYCETIYREDHPAKGIIDVASSKNCDLIIMASHGRRGVNKVLLGSVTSEVLTRSSIPVLVIR